VVPNGRGIKVWRIK